MLYLQVDWGFLGDLFSGIIGAIVAAIQAVLIFIWNTLVIVANFLWAVLVNVANFLVRMFRHARLFFRNLWDNFIKRGVLKILELWQRLLDRLNRILAPIIKWIEKVRAFIDKWYFKLFGPILNAIQTLRRILVVFRILGFKWAKKLDERLFRLESKLLDAYLKLRRALNEVISFLHLAFDPNGLLSRVSLLQSIGRIFGLLADLTGARMGRKLTISEEEAQERDRTALKTEAVIAYHKTLAEEGLPGEDKALLKQTDEEITELTGIPGSALPPPP